jgi:hypothetical protein
VFERKYVSKQTFKSPLLLRCSYVMCSVAPNTASDSLKPNHASYNSKKSDSCILNVTKALVAFRHIK